ncbi:putative haloacid dehalogenase-like hydrolase [Leptomonas pyrrhocoris]|uniref:Putative haloacid dehalogenase-like hydrolase n=1 Tax=Leptomonas pyrrhocoris TaxID=157538 RepID=A0A0N0DZI9_LEPPY|nr:putative haloacid dehalogenase-like hydrolase [Leptomonas pyrrhocoris]KPA85355.1 putative haloacid dehalogenase-like hydrolase [Leptomonas pyrrhocoris]|eukprot:XP_015663794.1 putative haloacid dehalogenase-like hydrolase [Leptomonas pyrrhocoris]
MSIKAVVTDMDGTLLNPAHQISDYTASVLKRLKERGIHFIVATGRPYGEVIQTIRKCQLEPDFILTSNGGWLHDGGFNVVLEHNIPSNLAQKLVLLHTLPHPEGGNAAAKTFVTNVYRNTEWLTDRDVPEISGGLHKNLPCTVLGEDLYALPTEELQGVHQIWYYGETEELRAVSTQLSATFGTDLCWTFSAPMMIDCGPVGVTKGNGVREVAEILKLRLEDVACFGDALNDESMLQIAGKAYIMENGQQELKDVIAHGEVIGSNANDGVARKLEQLFFSS